MVQQIFRTRSKFSDLFRLVWESLKFSFDVDYLFFKLCLYIVVLKFRIIWHRWWRDLVEQSFSSDEKFGSKMLNMIRISILLAIAIDRKNLFNNIGEVLAQVTAQYSEKMWYNIFFENISGVWWKKLARKCGIYTRFFAFNKNQNRSQIFIE